MADSAELPGVGPASYAEAAVQRLLAEHPAVADQGLEITVQGTVLRLLGEVESEQRRAAILQLIGVRFPELEVRDDIRVTRCAPPDGAEELS